MMTMTDGWGKYINMGTGITGLLCVYSKRLLCRAVNKVRVDEVLVILIIEAQFGMSPSHRHFCTVGTS